MAEEKQETREQEVARVRSYLASQSMKRTSAQIIETVREAHRQFLEALALVPDSAFHTIPQEDSWSAAEVLNHVYLIAAFDEQSICSVIERGEQPPDVSDVKGPPSDMTREQMLAAITASRERLSAVVLQADPQKHLEIVWGHREFGKMNWREWLLFARVHTLDHARQMQAIAAALPQ